jgi:hypothetical protein
MAKPIQAGRSERISKGTAMPYVKTVDIPGDVTLERIDQLPLLRHWRLRFQQVWISGGCLNAFIHDGREARLVRWPSDWSLLSLWDSVDLLAREGIELPYVSPADAQKWEDAARLIMAFAVNSSQLLS